MMFRVEVVYAAPAQQWVVEVELQDGATLRDAVTASGLLAHFPGIDIAQVAVGVFGERRALDDKVEPGDRVELYRSLIADPKEARRRRATKQRIK